MKRVTIGIMLLYGTGRLAVGQPAEAPAQFDFADVHPSPPAADNRFQFLHTGPVHNGRYEVKTATMVDLIQQAYGFNPDKILGGPNWLELDRFDVIAKVPPGTTPDSQKLMLQSLLEERFKLVTHKDTKPLPAYALVAGKKPQLKEAAGTEESGCKPDNSSTPPGEGGMRVMMNMNGNPMTLTLGPGGIIQYNCRNITMAAFAEGLRTMMGANLGVNPVLDETGLKGRWNFDVRWSFMMMPIGGNGSDRITAFDAVEKQLGLKLEERQVPTPVLVVDSANRKPAANPPGTAEALPLPPVATEFDVASIKPSDPGGRGGRFQLQAGGRLSAQNMSLSFLVNRAFNINNNDQVTGLPAFADSERFDVEAKSSGLESAGPGDMFAVAPLMRALLADRFKMTFHTDEQQVSAYSLVQAKPKMKKADPDSRISCKFPTPPPGTPQGTRILTCQNTTMAQFAERLQSQSPELTWPIMDVTELEGGWDFTVTWTQNFGMVFAGRGGDGGPPGGAPAASDPTGGLSIFTAIEKQLGLKLEKIKRSVPVYVIDHIEQKPTEN